MNPRSATGRARGKRTTRLVRPREPESPVAERRAKNSVGAMTRPGRQNRSGGARGGWIGRERGEAGFTGRTRTVGRRRTRCEATGRLPIVAAMPKHRRRIRPERFSRKRPPPASTIASVLHGGKPQGRAPGGGPGQSAGHDWRKRRSGIVRRPARFTPIHRREPAPDSASRPECAEGDETS